MVLRYARFARKSSANINGIGWLVGGSFIAEAFLAINVTLWCTNINHKGLQLSLNVLLVMDCATTWCGSQVQPTKMIQRVLSSSELRAQSSGVRSQESGVLRARQRVLSSSEVGTSDLEHGGSWVVIPSGAQIFFCVLLWLILYIPLYFLYNTNIHKS